MILTKEDYLQHYDEDRIQEKLGCLFSTRLWRKGSLKGVLYVSHIARKVQTLAFFKLLIINDTSPYRFLLMYTYFSPLVLLNLAALLQVLQR